MYNKDQHDICCWYYILPNGRYKVSFLTGNGHGHDVAAVAKAINPKGGGRVRAAGFDCESVSFYKDEVYFESYSKELRGYYLNFIDYSDEKV